MAARESGWTAAIRDRVARTLPLTELLPTRQPAYVGSWVYVFGVVTIAALVWVVLSGVVLTFFGSAWWHISPIGRFFNSVHFWSVQMFFIFMVLHLWGQYWGAGWRDGRAPDLDDRRGHLPGQRGDGFHRLRLQQNFDSQWIAVNAKDAVNSIGLGGLFNVTNFGQQYGLHVMLFPIGVTFWWSCTSFRCEAVVWCVPSAIRCRRSNRRGHRNEGLHAGRRRIDKERYYRGVAHGAVRPAQGTDDRDVGVLGIVLVLSVVLSSPDVPSVTIQSWSKADPVDFVTTATGELAGTTSVASYGPPYNTGSGSVQSWGFLHPQEWVGGARRHQPAE